MKPRAIDFISYNVKDMGRAEAFYRDVLGLDVAVPWGGEGNRFPEFDVNGIAFSLTALPQLPDGGMVALAVDDVRGALDELRARDVAVKMDTLETSVCYMAIIADPDGNQILLHQRKDGSAG